jgi:serine phosphatase RsbU (regulator of sigma subunit)
MANAAFRNEKCPPGSEIPASVGRHSGEPSSAPRSDEVSTPLGVREGAALLNSQPAMIEPPVLGRRSRTRLGFGAYCRSAGPRGGDVCEVLPLNASTVLLVVADAMGRDSRAALMADRFRVTARALAPQISSPSRLLSRLNASLYDELSERDMFITAQIALIDSLARRATVSSAGHCPALVCDRLGSVQSLSPDGLPLGIAPGAAFDEISIALKPPSRMLLFTDGIIETRNGRGEFFGSHRLADWLARAAASNCTTRQLKEGLLAELAGFQAHPPEDDQAFLILSDELLAHAA